MGILDNLKNQVEKLGDKAREGLGDVKDRAGDLVGDAKERLGHDDETAPLTESSDVGPDSSSTDAVQPGYVTAEDDVTEDSDLGSLDAEVGLEADDQLEPDDQPEADDLLGTTSDVVPPAAAELDPVELDAQETAVPDADEPVGTAADEPVVEKDVDPYEQPLTESIGDALVNADAVTHAVDPERPQA